MKFTQDFKYIWKIPQKKLIKDFLALTCVTERDVSFFNHDRFDLSTFSDLLSPPSPFFFSFSSAFLLFLKKTRKLPYTKEKSELKFTLYIFIYYYILDYAKAK